MSMADQPRRPLHDRIIRAIPIVGFAARLMEENRPYALVVLLVNVIMAIALAVIFFGFPALITAMLVITGIVFVMLLLTTRG